VRFVPITNIERQRNPRPGHRGRDKGTKDLYLEEIKHREPLKTMKDLPS
jgi:hypothetical protein